MCATTTRQPTATSKPRRQRKDVKDKSKTLIITTKPDLLNDKDFAELIAMLTFKRPAGSKTELAFIKRFIEPLGAKPDKYGNHWLIVGDTSPTIMFSSHTDTVHDTGGRQQIFYDKSGIGLSDPHDKLADCLGADCTAGVWLMMQMIRAQVPGLYIFHRDEESGCRGSRWIAEHNAEALSGIKAAIAFDRMGTTDVITHQCGYRCASDEFAESLATLLPGKFEPAEGVITDTESYTEIIPECTNLSVGYYKQHTPDEWQDYDFLMRLRDALIAADWSKLVIKRDPTTKPLNKYGAYGSYSSYSGTSYYGRSNYYDKFFDLVNDGFDPDPDLQRFVEVHPMSVAKFLESQGFTKDDIIAELIHSGYWNNCK